MSSDTNDKGTAAARPGTPTLETAISRDTTTRFQDGEAGQFSDEGVSVQFDGKDPSDVRTGLGDLKDAADGDGGGDGSEGTGEAAEGAGDAPEGEQGDGASKLPDWDPENEETVAAYDAKFFTEDGSLDVRGTLSQEFWANYRKDPDAFKDPAKGGLNEETYAYLKDRMGLSREDVLQVERGQLAIAKAAEADFYNTVGGKARWEGAVKWGREGGYTPAQIERFNKAMEKGGEDAEEAAAALMGRYDAKHPRRDGGFRKGPPRRQSSPQRDATRGAATGGSGQGGDVFKSAAEYNAAISEARKSGDKKQIDAVRAKGKRSRFN